jgi:deoxyguanosine kinase
LSHQAQDRTWHIIIEGAIGVGKTTLARMLRDEFETNLLLEVFEENPFLASFYQDRERYAFQTQMFFLLSRYRQQQQQVPLFLEQGDLFSDYMFAKDRIFAQLNLAGDEWEIYQQIHGALAEQIPDPDLLVYLKADTKVLMGRIAQRDRPYEREMDEFYIDQLRRAYDQFFSAQKVAPVLTINTNDLNFVTRREDYNLIVERIRKGLQEQIPQRQGERDEGQPYQERGDLARGHLLSDYQRFHVELDKINNFSTDVYFNYLCLSEEIGELGSELAKLWKVEHGMVDEGHTVAQAREKAIEQQKQDFESELADCMAYLLKLANYAGIDLETAYLKKMEVNRNRKW